MALTVNGTHYLTVAEVAKAAGVSRQTLWRWRLEGTIPAGSRYRGRQVLFTLEENEAVRQFAHRIEPSPTPATRAGTAAREGGSL